MWSRYRFHANEEDSRPVKFPPPGPYWETAVGDGYAIVVAFLPEGGDIRAYWPEASEVEVEEVEKITFTSRFRKPNWWNPAPAQPL